MARQTRPRKVDLKKRIFHDSLPSPILSNSPPPAPATCEKRPPSAQILPQNTTQAGFWTADLFGKAPVGKRVYRFEFFGHIF
ncbi:MAG: hypothetical protein DBX55_08585 [Verrucomicrobia bacterium]|nr:MAG: hypothetical protein DBX55_08585 [Verrucomicrobiota bacterium]